MEQQILNPPPPCPDCGLVAGVHWGECSCRPKGVRAVPIPPQMAHLEVDPRGYPKFFVVQAPEGREFSFKVINPMNQERCGKERLCAICGKGLSYYFVFTGGLESYEAGMFGTGPMHRACLDYALKVCPFLIGAYEPKHLDPVNPLYVKSKTQSAIHPEVSVIYETRGIKRFGPLERDGLLMFVPEAPTKLEFFDRAGKPIPAPRKGMRYGKA